MKCPKCGSTNTKIVGTDWAGRKRMGCKDCLRTSYVSKE